ncbi:MAG: hypothetical protein KAJ07_07820 [Planctomycetes bacterium]|nr:hypothetical protein [Planctomycetota bacterium]
MPLAVSIRDLTDYSSFGPPPDNKWLIFIFYNNKERPGDYLPNKDVSLHIMSTDGGQGTINVPSQAPDSSKFAFVDYRLVKP